MPKYIVVNQPALARPNPIMAGPVINAYPIGSMIDIVDVDSGWYKTTSGTYIFETKQNMMLYTKWKRLHKDDLVMTTAVNPKIPPELKRSLRKLGDAITLDSQVKIKEEDTTDILTGANLPAEWYKDGVQLYIKEIDGDKVVLQDVSRPGKPTYTVNASDLQVWDPEENDGEGDWVDASDLSTIAQGEVDSAVSTIKGIFSGEDDSDKREENAVRNIANLDITHLRSVHGMPYQFLPWADNRINGSVSDLNIMGRKYAEKIATRAPIMILQAGVPTFMKGWSEDQQTSIIESLIADIEMDKDTAEQIANTPGKYYSLKLVPGQYFQAVNEMTRAMAKLLGIADIEWVINGVEGTLGDIRWETVTNKNAFGHYGNSVPFYIHSEPQISEALSNQVGPSQLLSKLNDIGRMGSEIQFLLGGASQKAGINLQNIIPGTKTAEELANSNVATDGGIMDSIIDNFQTAIAGGRFIFPDLWQDSQFSRSYNVTIKLDSPDADPISIFINIFVPLAHLLAFTLPRSIGMNNYISPFLVRAYYKSMFHIDMGMITDCQITKGDVGAWTQQGLPTQVTVQLTIKDLYNLISLATGWGNNSITSNPGQLDYIANMCGVNLDAPSIKRTIQLWWTINGAGSIVSRVETAFDGMLTTVYDNAVRRIESAILGTVR